MWTTSCSIEHKKNLLDKLMASQKMIFHNLGMAKLCFKFSNFESEDKTLDSKVQITWKPIYDFCKVSNRAGGDDGSLH